MCHFNIEICGTCGVPRTLLSLTSCGDCGPESANEVITTNLHKYTWFGGDRVNELGRFIYPDESTCRCIDPPPRLPIEDPQALQTLIAATVAQADDGGFQNDYGLDAEIDLIVDLMVNMFYGSTNMY